MPVTARAPGKLVLAGEYAVLEGAPAAVMALDRRARAQVRPSADGVFRVHAPNLGIREAIAQLDGHRLRWRNAGVGEKEKLKLVSAIVEYLARCEGLLDPLAMRLDTSEFFAPSGRGKLGLGSSAALTVALAGAIHALYGRKTPGASAMMSMHRAIQDGRGSGLDIAASRTGGTIIYRLGGSKPQLHGVGWPQGLKWCVIWSGRPAATGDALARLARWRARNETAYTRFMDELGATAANVARALAGERCAALLAGIDAYASELERFGVACGIDIVCAEHRELGAHAAECGVTYKPCGAGGGDVGIALSEDAEALRRFGRRAAGSGFSVLNTGIAPGGLEIQA